VNSLQELGRNYPWVSVAIIYESQDDPTAPGKSSEGHFGLFSADTLNADPVAKPAVNAIKKLYSIE
jgi:hypothetical protein